MLVHQLGQLAGYKQFTDWSNNTWQMGISHPGNVSIVCYTIAEYRADSVTCYAG